MEIELRPAVSLLEETLNVLIDTAEMLIDALNSHMELQATGFYSSAATILASSVGFNKRFTDLEIRRPSHPSSS